MNVAACYLSYLAISIGLTVWVARTLHRSGRVFLVDAFHGNAELADSVNHLLVVGFYLINVGYIALALTTTAALTTFREIIELESVKIGVVLLILGGMHFFNILVFAKMRSRGRTSVAPPPYAGGQGLGLQNTVRVLD
jgi:cytochrome c biogenesis protein CcdA